MNGSRFGLVGLGVACAMGTQFAYAQTNANGSQLPAPPAAASVPLGASSAVATDDSTRQGTSGLLVPAPAAPAGAPSADTATTRAAQSVEALERRNGDLEARIAKLEAGQRSLEKREADQKAASDQKPAGIQVVPYGFIKLGVAHDSSRTAFGDLAFFVLPDSKPGGGQRELTFGARESRFGLKLSAPELAGIVVSGQFEADWFEEAATASKYSPRLRLAFLDLALGAGWSLRAGQDWDLYVGAQPKTADAAILGATGHLYGRRPQLKLTKVVKFGQTSSITVKLGAAHGRTQDLDADGQLDADAAGVPSIQGGVVLASTLLGNKPTTLSISGAYGQEKVHLPLPTATTASDHTKTFDATLVHASLALPVANCLTLQGVAWWGKNVDQYYGGVLQGINAAREREIEAVGGWGQVIWDATSAWSVSAALGADDPVNGDVAQGGRTFNGRAFANVFFKPTNDVLIVAEYGYLKTKVRAEPAATNHRTQLAFQYTF